LRGDEEAPFAAGGHELEAFCPSFDDGIQGEGGRLAAADAAVEDGAVDERSVVVAGDFVGCAGFGAGAFGENLILEAAGEGDDAGFCLVGFEEFLAGFGVGGGFFFV